MSDLEGTKYGRPTFEKYADDDDSEICHADDDHTLTPIMTDNYLVAEVVLPKGNKMWLGKWLVGKGMTMDSQLDVPTATPSSI